MLCTDFRNVDLLFDERIQFSEDLDFFFRLYLRASSVFYVKEMTYIYRKHGMSSTDNYDEIKALQRLEIYKKMFQQIEKLGLPTFYYFKMLETVVVDGINMFPTSKAIREYESFVSEIRERVTYPQPLISLVVPIYNVYPYLQLCLESIEKQTYPHFEVLLINDGSRDNSKDICLEFVERDNRFKYIEQQNGGLSAARNTGILNAKGEFITFIDGDDFVDPTYLEELYHAALRNDSEIVIGSYKEFNEEDNNYYIHVFDDKEAFFDQNELITKRGIEFETSWGILFHKRLFENIRFPVGKSIGDCFTNYKLFMESCKASYI